jgi:hypothetical protein
MVAVAASVGGGVSVGLVVPGAMGVSVGLVVLGGVGVNARVLDSERAGAAWQAPSRLAKTIKRPVSSIFMRGAFETVNPRALRRPKIKD